MKQEPRRDEGGRVAVAYGGLLFAIVAPAAYILQRLYGHWRSPGMVNPAMILQSSHVGYHWRVAIATWLAVAIAMLVARRSTRMSALALSSTAATSVAVTALLAALWP